MKEEDEIKIWWMCGFVVMIGLPYIHIALSPLLILYGLYMGSYFRERNWISGFKKVIVLATRVEHERR